MNPHAHMDMMQLIATFQQEVRELIAQDEVSGKPDFNVTMHTASPAPSSAVYFPIASPKFDDLKVIKFAKEDQHSGLGADGKSFDKEFDVQIYKLETLISLSVMKSTG